MIFDVGSKIPGIGIQGKFSSMPVSILQNPMSKSSKMYSIFLLLMTPPSADLHKND
jgi:hypothetical protein